MDPEHKKPGDRKLTLDWLKKNLASTIGEDLIKEGFSSDKKQTKFKKTVGPKNKIELYFECYAFSLKVEFKLVTDFYITEIEKEREKFRNFCHLELTRKWTVMLSEGFYHPKTKELDFKYQVAATHVIY